MAVLEAREAQVASARRVATRRLAWGLVTLLLFAAGGAVAQGAALEYAVKAAYLYKFTPFVRWPAEAFPGPTSPLTLCIAGEDPFGPALDQAVRGQTVGDRRLAVRRLAPGERPTGCHLLFVGRMRDGGVAQALAAVSRQPVLTVTDRSRGVDGGIVQFVMLDGRVRFAIDAARAQASGLAISSKLLGLGVSPRGEVR
ncbi:MAG: YfiR family protein [Caulobacteraceae bacterium]|nr:YfiR family protein [Caulobacteraceae bacterium]